MSIPKKKNLQAEAIEQAAADPDIQVEVRALIHAANRQAAHILAKGSPEEKAKIMRMIFGHTIKEVMSPKHDQEANEDAERLAEFHDLRREMLPEEE